MAIKIKDLIKKLSGKDQNADVEFVVVKTGGEAVCMDVKTAAKCMVDLLKLIGNDAKTENPSCFGKRLGCEACTHGCPVADECYGEDAAAS